MGEFIDISQGWAKGPDNALADTQIAMAIRFGRTAEEAGIDSAAGKEALDKYKQFQEIYAGFAAKFNNLLIDKKDGITAYSLTVGFN